MRNAILSANSLGDLAAVAGKVPGLELPLFVAIDDASFSKETRARLAPLTGVGLKLREFLNRKDLHRAHLPQPHYGVFLRELKTWMTSKAPESHATAVTRLIEQTGIPDLSRWPAAAMGVDGYGSATVADLLRQSELYSYSASYMAPLASGLRAFAAKAEDAQKDALTRPLQSRLTMLGDPELDGIRAALCTLRTTEYRAWPLGSFTVAPAFRHDDDGLVLAVRLAKGAEAAMVVWRRPAAWAERLDIRCSTCRGPCVHVAVFLETVLSGTESAGSKPSTMLKELLSPPWHRALGLMETWDEPDRKRELLSFVVDEVELLEVRVHPVGKKGMGQGRRVYRDQVYDHASQLEPLDRRIAELLRLSERGTDDDGTELGDALLLLAEHPRVHTKHDGPPVPVRVRTAGLSLALTEGAVELDVERPGGPDKDWCRSSRGLVRIEISDNEVTLVVMPPELRRVAEAVDRFGRTFPREALPRLAALLPSYEAMTRVELPDALRGQEVPPQNRPVLRLDTSHGVSVDLRIEPLPGAAVFVPGEGVPVAATFDGTHRRFAQRALEAEVAEANALAAELGLGTPKQPFSWHLEASDEAVELLRRISLVGPRVTVECTGVRPTFRQEAGLERLKLRVTAKRDWFGLEGQLTVDDARVTLAQLLEAARERRRWVKLSATDFVGLSQELLDRLAPLAHLAGKDEHPTLTLGTVPIVDELEGHVAELDAAKGYRDLVERMAQTKDRTYPVPKKLKASLRDYQREGFEWLCRLAEWGAGAILADDMGLGKTLQALALLVARAGEGPGLVIAPSSVLYGWRAEAERFAPSLRLHLFHEGDRELDALGKGDVLVVSWGLLAREAPRLQAAHFATVVLDEAQAIKNSETLRAKAAHGLDAGFVVALSGTPVENHVGELWSLFRAVVPSLLGSEASFQERFGSARGPSLMALARLVRPFILRRTKEKVATELPSRTEVEVLVPLTDAERELYEDVRLAAVQELGESTGSDKRFEVLAALTRLRLAAGHPRLVDAGWKGPTSKLSRLLELVRDLGAGGHKALVFSQFTQHLGLVADALRAEGVAFSYLDGQVPAAERARRVAQFQDGKGGDVFLISLKAGGTGLTLTAADYVLHLDPWWNPAVEDQASDRAHRIGQTQPVTIYRLIAEGTIEQRILSLHTEKRELVDALLAGTEKVGKLSMSQLAALIREEGPLQ